MLDVQLTNMLKALAAAGTPDLADLPVPAQREMFRQIVAGSGLPPADVRVDNHRIGGPGGILPLRIYTPLESAMQPRGAVLFLHGGGFVVGDLDTYDSLCRTICADSGCIVVSVDYRLAPEQPFPAAVDDCRAALKWLSANAHSIGADPTRLAVCGDSAGGNLAAVMALLARAEGIRLRYQVLIYPVTAAAPGDLASHTEFGEGYTLSRRGMNDYTKQYFGPDARAPDWRGAPLLAENLSDLPAALVLVGAYDPLRDDGVAYADAMTAAGNQVTLVEYRGMSHGFLGMGTFLTAGRVALDQVCCALRRSLAA